MRGEGSWPSGVNPDQCDMLTAFCLCWLFFERTHIYVKFMIFKLVSQQFGPWSWPSTLQRPKTFNYEPKGISSSGSDSGLGGGPRHQDQVRDSNLFLFLALTLAFGSSAISISNATHGMYGLSESQGQRRERWRWRWRKDLYPYLFHYRRLLLPPAKKLLPFASELQNDKRQRARQTHSEKLATIVGDWVAGWLGGWVGWCVCPL